MLKLFCIPGRLLAKIFSREKRRTYRSIRSKPVYGPGIILVSLVSWLALAGGVLFAVDKAGLLKQALDVGVEVAQGNGEAPVPPPDDLPANPEPAQTTTPTGSGGLSPEGQSTTGLPQVAPSGPESPTTGTTTPVPGAEQWLVILRSVKKDAKDSRAEAEKLRDRYRTKGLEVDVFDAGAFPRLDKSYWIVALGPFEGRAKAVIVLDKAKKIEPGLMIRQGL